MNTYDKEGQSLRSNLLVFNPEEREVVVFYTRKISVDRNDVIHNASGPAVKFGKTSSRDSWPPAPNPHSNSESIAMSNRYKIFQVERNPMGVLPGVARITLGPKTISAVLKDEMARAGGADAFGVENETFAWFEDRPFVTLIFQEEDDHFNIDHAMSQLANFPGKAGLDFFAVIEARITRRESQLDPILRGQGLLPMAAGGHLPLHGMHGTVYRDPAPNAYPVFAAPPPPRLAGSPGDADFDDLMEAWFKGIQEVLKALKANFGGIRVIFHGGGNVLIPCWFLDWCAAENIIIVI